MKAIRSLSFAAAAEGRRVELTGVVLTLSGWQSSFFLEEKGSGISVDRLDADLTQVKAGDRVVVRGVTAPGSFAPIVKSSSVQVLGTMKLPLASSHKALEFAGGRLDSQWVAVSGNVRSAMVKRIWGHDRLTLILGTDLGSATEVRIHDADLSQVSSLVGAYVRVSGVCGTVFSHDRQFTGVRLFTPDLRTVEVLRRAPQDPFALPLRPLNALMQFDSRAQDNSLLHVTGTVTWARSDAGFYLQSGDKGLYVEWKDAVVPALGALAEVVGYPFVGHGSVRLQAVFLRSSMRASTVVPLAVQADHIIGTRDEFIVTPSEGLLVSVDGQLVNVVEGPEHNKLLLSAGSTSFTAHVPASAKLNLQRGAVLRVTGICTIDYDDYTNEPSAFYLRSRSAADVFVIRPAPWWNAAHTRRVAELLALLLAILLCGILLSRQRVLRNLATTDSLTGLVNRRTLLRRLTSVRAQANGRHESLYLLFFDVDRFKEINDQYGHRRGDQALVQVAQLLRKTFPEIHTLARVGGDEFIAILRDVRDTQFELRLQLALASLNKQRDSVPLSVSCGVLPVGEGEALLANEELMERSDLLMYQAKRTNLAPVMS